MKTIRLTFAVITIFITSHASHPLLRCMRNSCRLPALVAGAAALCWNDANGVPMGVASAASDIPTIISPATEEATPLPAVGKITSQAYLDISIARGPPERISVGIFGDDAPRSSKFWLSVCKAEYGEGTSYDGSQVSKVQKDRIITVGKLARGGGQKQETWMDEVGKVRIRNVNLAESFVNTDNNELKHDTNGIVSIPKAGGTFEFSIVPRQNAELDNDNLVIGKVLSGMDVVDKINEIPVSREDSLGSKAAFSNAGKGFDPRAKLASLDRPLKQIKVLRCQVDEKANNVASFLKF